MMRYPLSAVAPVLFAGTVLLTADEPRNPRDRSREAAITVDADQLVFTPGGAGEVLITDIKTKSEYSLSVPGSKERVSEVRACRWVKRGFAVAVETIPEKPAKPEQRSYYWITGWLENLQPATEKSEPRRAVKRTGERFLTSDENFDLGMIANPQGDSIYILLTKFRRAADGDEISGYSFSNNCPIAAPHAGGLLQRIASDPKTMEWVNIHPDDEPARP